MATFDEMLLSKLNEIGQQRQEPSLTEKKAAIVNEKYKEKKAVIEPAQLEYWPDADSPKFVGQPMQDRTSRFDSMEVPHWIDPNDPTQAKRLAAQQNRLNRQRRILADRTRQDFTDIKDEDIYREGVKESLSGLYKAIGSPKYRDAQGNLVEWTPGPISQDWLKATPENPEPATIGSKGTPLDIVMGRRALGEKDKYGRQLTELYTPTKDGKYQSYNSAMMTGDNATAFDKEGHFDKLKALDRNAVAAGWKGTLPSKMTDPDEIENFNQWFRHTDDSTDFWDNTKRSIVQQTAKLGRGIGETATQLGNRFGFKDIDINPIGNMYGSEDIISKRLKSIDKKYDNSKVDENNFLGTGLSMEKVAKNEGNILDQRFGVNRQLRQLAQELTKIKEEDIRKGNKIDWAIHALDSLPMEISDSAGAILGLMLPGGSFAFTAGEMPDQEAKFEKANNRKMTNSEYLQTLAATYGTTVVEKLLAKMGLRKIGDILTAPVKGRGKKILGSTLGLAGAVGGEVLQEGSEAIREGLTGRKLKEGENLLFDSSIGSTIWDIAKKPETINQALSAGMAAGAMAGAGGAGATTLNTVVNAPEIAKNLYDLHQNKKNEEEFNVAVDNMSNSDFKLTADTLNASIEADEKNIQNVDKATEHVEKAESVDDIENSPFTEVNEFVSKLKEEAKNTDAFYSDPDTVKVVTEAIASMDPAKKAEYGITEDMTPEDVYKQIVSDEDINAKSIISDIVGEEVFNDLASNYLDNNIDNVKETISTALGSIKDSVNTRKEKTAETLNKIANRRKEKNLSGRRTEGKISTEDETSVKAASKGELESEAEKMTISKAISEIIKTATGVNRKNRKEIESNIEKTLSKYSTKTLEKYANKTNNKFAKSAANRIIENRKMSKRKLGTEKDYDLAEEPTYSWQKDAKTKDATLSKIPSKAQENYQKIKNLVQQGNLYSKKEKARIEDRIDALQNQGDITKNEAKVLKKRLNEASSNVEKGVKSDIKKKTPVIESSEDIKNEVSKLQKIRNKLYKKLTKAKDEAVKKDIATELAAIDEEISNRFEDMKQTAAYEIYEAKQQPGGSKTTQEPVAGETREQTTNNVEDPIMKVDSVPEQDSTGDHVVNNNNIHEKRANGIEPEPGETFEDVSDEDFFKKMCK